MAGRQFDGFPAHGRRTSVQTREVDAVDAPDHARPVGRINNFVKLQAFLGAVIKRACHPHLPDRKACLVQEIVKAVIVKTKTGVGRPDVADAPVIKRVGADGHGISPCNPLPSLIRRPFIAAGNGGVSVEAFIRPQPYHDGSASVFFGKMA